MTDLLCDFSRKIDQDLSRSLYVYKHRFFKKQNIFCMGWGVYLFKKIEQEGTRKYNIYYMYNNTYFTYYIYHMYKYDMIDIQYIYSIISSYLSFLQSPR